MEIALGLFGGATPSYTPPPAPPPAAAPATLASSSVASAAAKRLSQNEAAVSEFGTEGKAQGVAPSSVSTAKTTLGGVS